MKKNSFKIIFSFLFIACSLFINIGNVNAEYETGKTYHITSVGAHLRNVSANSSAYVKSSTSYSTEYVVGKTLCDKKSGTYNTSDCIYRYETNYVTCGISSSCTAVNANQATITYTSSSTNYAVLQNARSACSSNVVAIDANCCTSQGCKAQKLKRTVVKSYGKKECQNSSYNSAKKQVGNFYYAPGPYSGCNKSTAAAACACTTSKTTTSTVTLNTSQGKVTETGAVAYCIAPGLKWPTSSTTYTPTPLNTKNCKEDPTRYECGLVAIFESQKTRGSNFDAMVMALRMWAAYVGKISPSEDGMTTEGQGGGSEEVFYMNTPIFKATAVAADSGYTGQTGKNGLAANLIYGTNATGTANLSEAIALYKIARAGSLQFWTPDITVPEEIQPDQDGNFTFTLTAKFDSANTSGISIVSNTPGITLSLANASACASGTCEVKGKIANYGEDNCLAAVSYTLKYTDKRDLAKNIHLLSPSDPTKYQRFIVYDTKAQESVYNDTLKLTPNCDSFECATPTDIQYNVPSKCSQGTNGTVKDPELNCIINLPELRDNYDYTTLYVKSTNSTVGNSSTRSSSFYSNIGNGFCQMQCRETITYKFFRRVSSESTRFYTYGSTLETIIGDRECSVQIDYQKWKKAYEQANENVRTTWNSYKYWENVHVYTPPRPNTESCSYPGGHSCSCGCCCCGRDQYGKCTGYSCCCYCSSASPCSYTITRLYWDPKTYAETTKSGAISIQTSSAVHGSLSCSGSVCGGWSRCTGSDGNPNAWAGAYSSAKSAYVNAVKSREALVADIQNCNLYSSYDLVPYTTEDYGKSVYTRANSNSAYYKATSGYDFKPEITYDYEDEYSSLIDIQTAVRLTKKTEATYCDGCKTIDETSGTNNKEEVVYWVCTGNQTGAKCTDKRLKVPKNTLAYITGQKTATYSQEALFATTIPDGNVVLDDPSNDQLLSLNKYPHIFPLEIGKRDGRYDAFSTYDVVGDKNRKPIVEIEGGDYECHIDVSNLITIPSGYYFRQIDVTNPFPHGVTTGTWNTQRAKNLIARVTNDGELVYKRNPEYEFLINPTNIHNIREYNRMMDYSGEGYNDFNLSCTCETEICYCESNFLQDISSYGPYSNFVKRFYRNGARQ